MVQAIARGANAAPYEDVPIPYMKPLTGTALNHEGVLEVVIAGKPRPVELRTILRQRTGKRDTMLQW